MTTPPPPYGLAHENLAAFIRELGFSDPPVLAVDLGPDGDGLFNFLLRRGIRHVTVSMPGIPLARVRSRTRSRERLASVRGRQRLYVDGNSWVWEYAIEMAREYLTSPIEFSRNARGRLCHEGVELEDGPWHAEPDMLEFRHANTPCRLVRGPQGAWCGYVGLAADHPWRQDSNAPDPTVHGGLTFAGPSTDVPENGIVFVPETQDILWIGFDCGHSGTHGDRVLVTRLTHGLYRNVAFARGETERLAAQASQAATWARLNRLRVLAASDEAGTRRHEEALEQVDAGKILRDRPAPDLHSIPRDHLAGAAGKVPPSITIRPDRLVRVRFREAGVEHTVVAISCGYITVRRFDGEPRIAVEVVVDPGAANPNVPYTCLISDLKRHVIPPRDLLGIRLHGSDPCASAARSPAFSPFDLAEDRDRDLRAVLAKAGVGLYAGAPLVPALECLVTRMQDTTRRHEEALEHVRRLDAQIARAQPLLDAIRRWDGTGSPSKTEPIRAHAVAWMTAEDDATRKPEPT